MTVRGERCYNSYTMQSALLDSFAVIPLALGLLLQGIAAILFFRIRSASPEKFPGNGFFVLPLSALAVEALASLAALFIPSLTIFAGGILITSFLSLALVVSFSRWEKKEETPEPVPEPVKEPEEDPLVDIGQRFLEHVSDSLANDVNLVRLLDFVNETQIEATGADGGVIFITDDFDDIIVSKSFRGSFPPPYQLPLDLPHKPVRVETNFRYAQFNLGESVFGEIATTGKAALIPDGTKDNRIYVNGPEDFLKPGSYIITPLMIKDRVVGVSGIARLPEREPLGEREFKIATTLSAYAGAAINNVYGMQEVLERADLEREASIASKIQKTLHPKRLPELPNVGFGSFFNSAKGVCGDYYDIILARRDRIGLTIADVAGKGIQSSMVMMMLRSILQLVTNTTRNAGTILDWVNKGITGKIDMDHYATISYVSYNPADRTIDYASAGHQPMLLWRADRQEIEIIRKQTDPIGIERASVYENQALTVGLGDIIILFTDGLIEALNHEGRQFGIENLSRVIRENNASSAKEISNEVKHNLQAFLGSTNLHDDQTLLIMKIKA